MNFFYLNLPRIPSNLTKLCFKNISLASSDPFLIEMNKKEGISHSITYLPSEVKIWLIENIIKILDPTFEHPELINNMYLHINKYIEHREGNGVHPIHIDYGRKFAFNYILTLGANNLPITTWYENDKTTIIEQHAIEPNRWHLIAVNPVFHGVRGQEKNQLRTIISLCYDPFDLNNFNPKKQFENIII
jgi:hypothetical protein